LVDELTKYLHVEWQCCFEETAAGLAGLAKSCLLAVVVLVLISSGKGSQNSDE